MSIPKYYEMYRFFLEALSDEKTHHYKEVKSFIANKFKLSEEEMGILLPSGRQTYFDNRVGWARTYLKNAGLIESPERANFIITKDGKEALKSSATIDNKYLLRYESFRIFKKITVSDNIDNTEPDNEQSPIEQIEEAYNAMNDALADELMIEVMKLSPTEFEKLVVRVLISLGYGGSIEDAGTVTKATGDGGIDGIIKEDQLGFSSIYVQAKQWDVSRTVDRPEIQKFAGALLSTQARKGVFITTARFSQGARDYINTQSSVKIVLVDGEQLSKLMIKNNIGVSTEIIYEIKRIDTDFFSDYL